VLNIQTATFVLFLKNLSAKKQPSGIDRIVGVRIANPGRPKLFFIFINLRFLAVKFFFTLVLLNRDLKNLSMSFQILELNNINTLQPVSPPSEQMIKVL